MKLTYRGQSYEMPAPVQLSADSADQPKIKMIYRGLIYYTTPRPVVASEAIESDGQTVTLIYRGVTYQRKVQRPKPYQPPRAINWRYQIN